jgi:ergothioneine biosynthesis protein EgtB
MTNTASHSIVRERSRGHEEPGHLFQRYLEVRHRSEEICSPLAVDDYQVQSVPEASPPKWHIAHSSWFFETFLLLDRLEGYRAFHPRFSHLFNSYYETAGTFHPRDRRHTLSRPTVEEVYEYRAWVDRGMERLLRDCDHARHPEIRERTVLGLEHECQHQELLLMDIKRNFFENPLYPVYREEAASSDGFGDSASHRWVDRPGGVFEIGHEGPGFCFDNEMPRHRVLLEDHGLGSRLVTNSEYLEFIEDGGYSDPRSWLSDGWQAVRARGWRAPLYWVEVEGSWHELTLHGLEPVRPANPVCHVSYYEADAFARWRGARLPLESELELAAAGEPLEGNFMESGLLHPRPARGDGDRQLFGDLWEWTRSPYSAYPGFRPLEGSLGEYNGKFMVNQMVLRGGSCVTPCENARKTYRNFFPPEERWPFTGIRLACDASRS